jgi:hypothetical protein
MIGTPRFDLLFLTAGQAQKEIYHNEALQILDAVVAAAVGEPPRNDPPTTPGLGSCFLVGDAPTGAWEGKPRHLAAFTSGGWRLIPPVQGMAVYVAPEGVWSIYRDGAWDVGAVRGSSLILDGQQVVGSRSSAIAAPAGGSTVDAEARTTIGQLLDAMRHHGLIEN